MNGYFDFSLSESKTIYSNDFVRMQLIVKYVALFINLILQDFTQIQSNALQGFSHLQTWISSVKCSTTLHFMVCNNYNNATEKLGVGCEVKLVTKDPNI